jgi:hypothetical protein
MEDMSQIWICYQCMVRMIYISQSLLQEIAQVKAKARSNAIVLIVIFKELRKRVSLETVLKQQSRLFERLQNKPLDLHLKTLLNLRRKSRRVIF